MSKTNELQPVKCCGEVPVVFEMRAGWWCVHCCQCLEGTDAEHNTRDAAVKDWNEQRGDQ